MRRYAAGARRQRPQDLDSCGARDGQFLTRKVARDRDDEGGDVCGHPPLAARVLFLYSARASARAYGFCCDVMKCGMSKLFSMQIISRMSYFCRRIGKENVIGCV